MKSKYPGFYSTPEESLSEIWSSDSTLFVFDTNCLLNLYRCEVHTREDILNVMSAISSRIWLPFQVGLEFQKNRRIVINSSIESLESIKVALTNIYTQNMLEHGKVKRTLYNTLSDEITNLQNTIREPINTFIENEITPRIKSKQDISSHDFIRDAIDNIIGENIGDIPTQEAIDIIDKEGEQRYSKKIPPGFKDSAKKDITYHAGITFQDKFGDLYLWKELINKASDENIKNIVLISDDTKDDWLFTYKNTTHGPLESLKTEICQRANINNFKLINQFTFLNDAKRFVEDVNVSDESLEEIEKLSLNKGFSELHDEIEYKNPHSLYKIDYHEHLEKLYVPHTAGSREKIVMHANEQLSIFDRLSDQCLSILNELAALNSEITETYENTEYFERQSYLSNLYSSARSLSHDLSELIIQQGELKKIIRFTSKLRQLCHRLEIENINTGSYLHSLY
ncbi:hypothetical protein CB020_22690 [Salmonella enterica]|nr:hypothetical protein [Salmonella enterica]EAZ4762105.1 hypothetical protein [Salmonella enterica]HAB4988678.1 hypothetical protein [Salmonella enterica subsp. salamae]HAB4991654.1 hypothetical protein [Salmonella enterica subsp. salamae]